MRARIPIEYCLVVLALAAAACSASSPGSKPAPEHGFTMFITTELRGSIEPCGCNSDPLGDIARTVEVVAAAKRQGRAVLVVDGGSLLYTEAPVPGHLKTQESLKAALIKDIYMSTLNAAAVGLGPYDLGEGPANMGPARQAANLAASSGVPLEAPKVIEIGGTRVGIFGVVSPAALSAFGLDVGDPERAAKEAIASLRTQEAQIVIALAHMTRQEATTLVRQAPGIDVLVIGQNAPEPDAIKQSPIRVGDTYMVQPANRGQVVTRLDVTVRNPGGPLVDAIGEVQAAAEIARLDQSIAELEAHLSAWKADPSADRSFVAGKERELVSLRAERQSLQNTPLRAPDKGSFFVMQQIMIKRRLPCNAAIQEAKVAYDKASSKANVAAAAGKKAPPPGPGEAGYVGVEECSMCHSREAEFWQKTRHHEAWETLEEVGKELSYDCISCHVTGWDRPGGATLADNEPLRDVQCEVCHGPGSIHVEKDGLDAPRTIVRTPPESLCVTCHNKEHSDTFQYEAYLRDVTGPGHGGGFRRSLGEGPTGHELRSAALEKAGREIGAGCRK